MKNIIFTALLCISLGITTSLFGARGCMYDRIYAPVPDRSWSRADYRPMQPVACACPCTDIIAQRGRCRRCMHYGDPSRGELNALQMYGSSEVFA